MRQLKFASLQVRDLEASRVFYETKLGFESVPLPNPDVVLFKYNNGEASFAIRRPLEDIGGKTLGIGVSVWFAVDENVAELKAHFIGKGVDVSTPITDTPFGRIFHVKDPDGYDLTFLEAK